MTTDNPRASRQCAWFWLRSTLTAGRGGVEAADCWSSGIGRIDTVHCIAATDWICEGLNDGSTQRGGDKLTPNRSSEGRSPMGSAVAQLLPLAIGAALSSVPISATLLILLSPKRERSALPFLLGWVGGMVVLVVLAGLGAAALPTPQVRAGVGVFVAETVVGLGLVCYGLIAALRAIRHPRLSSTNRWLDAVASFGPRSAFGLAVALNFRPKGLLLTIAAGIALAGARVSWPDALILLAGYLVLAVSTVVAPIVVTLAAPGRTEPKLMAARDWLERNGSIVTAVVMGVVGVFIALSGLTKLL